MLYTNARAQATEVQQQIMWSTAALIYFTWFFLSLSFFLFNLCLYFYDPMKKKKDLYK